MFPVRGWDWLARLCLIWMHHFLPRLFVQLEAYTATAGCCSRAIFSFVELDDKNFNSTGAIEYANNSCGLPAMQPVCLPGE